MLFEIRLAPRASAARFRLFAILCVAVIATFAMASTSEAAPYEPNDVALQAVGPMTGDTNYDVTKETTNDEDWFYFYTAGQAQMSLQLTKLGGDCAYDDLELYNASVSEMRSMDVYTEHPFDEHLFTVSGAKKFYIRAFFPGQSVGCTLRIRLTPAGAVTATPPPSSLQIQTCLTAQANVTKFSRAIKSAKRKRKKAKRRATKRVLRRRIINYTISLNGANQQVLTQCSPQVLELIRNDALKATTS